jgi:glycerophosphoryl diester phosphodiesterase
VPVEVVNADFVANAHANGLAVHVWTINDVVTMCALLDADVDGIMTDFPTLLEQVLADPAAACG